MFSDASEKAYGTVGYNRSTDAAGTCRVSLVSGKTRVAPVKKLTLPRLELMGCLLSTKLAKTMKEELEIEVKTLLDRLPNCLGMGTEKSSLAKDVCGESYPDYPNDVRTTGLALRGGEGKSARPMLEGDNIRSNHRPKKHMVERARLVKRSQRNVAFPKTR
jgi:Pao retrotransposon peptidase